jgi:two-component system chemotaxis sensor kinase CheA
MDRARYGELFLAEAREHLAAVNDALLHLEREPSAREPVVALFRAMHTLKGMAAAMGFDAVASLAHEAENLLERIRRGERAVDAGLIDLLLRAADALEDGVERSVAGEEVSAPAELLEDLRAWAAPSAGPAGAGKTTKAKARRSPRGDDQPTTPPGAGRWWVEAEFDPASPLPGARAFLLLRQARTLGSVRDLDPPEDQLTQEGLGRRVRFRLDTAMPADQIRPVLASVGDVVRLEIRPADEALGVASGPDPLRVEALRARTVRVDVRALDALVDQVGELVLARDRLRQLTATRGDPEFEEVAHRLDRLVSDLQDQTLRLRAVPVATVFDRFPRLVREAARALGKQVRFEIEGRDIELDRSLLDELADPLVHLLRNAVDHGVEPPEERVARGKPPMATVVLRAARERSQAVIQVRDDGRGIQRERVRARAVELGLMSPEEAAALTPAELYALLLRPGFSTAERVTDVSGRGVGLDVVATRLRARGGTLEIDSREGEGTTFTLRLPLTLAILPALLVRIGADVYLLPVVHVLEALEHDPQTVAFVGGRPMVAVRDAWLPLVDGRALLGVDGNGANASARSLVILESGEQRLGLLVDDVLGQREVVVKSFDATVDTLRLFAGATILSRGEPALILDAGAVLAAPVRRST